MLVVGFHEALLVLFARRVRLPRLRTDCGEAVSKDLTDERRAVIFPETGLAVGGAVL